MKKKPDHFTSVKRKTKKIFARAFGDRADRLFAAGLPAMEVIRKAYLRKYGAKRAHLLGFNIADWPSDAAYIVALHLFPEKFSNEEITALVTLVLGHVPNHLLAAAKVADIEVGDTWNLDVFPKPKNRLKRNSI